MKLLSIIAAAVMAASPVSSAAENSFSYSGAVFTYEISSDETVTITGITPDKGTTELHIPSKAAGMPVTVIADRALFGCTGITDITLPASLKEIGDEAFAGCVDLKTITIPDSVTYIGSEAFLSCTDLTSVKIGSGVKRIPYGCFYACSSLKTVTLPDELTGINGEAFFGCTALDDMYIPENVTMMGWHSVGYRADQHYSGAVKIPGFLITGASGSAAESYAYSSSIDFIDSRNFTPGFVNGDNSLDAADASEVLAEYARVSTGMLGTFTKRQQMMADMNKDGRIDSTDASLILQEYARLSTSGSI